MRKKLIAFLCVVMVLMSIPNFAFAEQEEYTGEFRKITTDGIWEVNSIKPKNASEGFRILRDLALNAINTEDYDAYVFFDEENFNPEKAVVGVISFDGKYSEEHSVNIIYNEPSQENIKEVNNIIDKIGFKEKYIVQDLTNINLIKSFSQYRKNRVHYSHYALGFNEEINNIEKEFNLETSFRAGAGDGSPLCLIDYGSVIVKRDGVVYSGEGIAVTLQMNNVLYVPENTENYAKAAEDRLRTYLGDENFTFSLGGTINSLINPEEGYVSIDDILQHGAIDKNKLADNNYYNLTIGDETYKFVLYKMPEQYLKFPVYKGKNSDDRIEVISESSSIPLDAVVYTDEVKNNNIAQIVGTDNYYAYDIVLKSKIVGGTIDSIKNGIFIVKIPIPNTLADKDIAVYHISDSGDKINYEVNVENGYAVFKTDHFSTYVLAEENVTNDNDGDGSATSSGDQVPPDNNGTNNDKTDNSNIPVTNDNRNTSLWLMIMVISAVTFIMIGIRQGLKK